MMTTTFDPDDPPMKWLMQSLRGLAVDLLADPKTPWIGERDPKQHICWTAADRLQHFSELSREGVPAVEVRRNPDESIDEICIDGGNVHIEQMSNDGWYMGVEAKDGSYWQFWFGAKNRKSHVEFRHTETMSAEENAQVLARRNALVSGSTEAGK